MAGSATGCRGGNSEDVSWVCSHLWAGLRLEVLLLMWFTHVAGKLYRPLQGLRECSHDMVAGFPQSEQCRSPW